MTGKSRVIVAGQSHANTLFGGRHRDFEAPALVKLEPDLEIYGLFSASPRPPGYWETLQREAEDSTVVLVWGGNDHNAWFLFELTPPFDFVRTDSEFVDPTAHLLPLSLVQRIFATTPHYARCREVVAMLKNAPGCRPMLAETVPPKGDDAALRRFLAVEFRQLMAERGVSAETAPLTKPEIRLKLWRCYRDTYRDLAKEFGVEFLDLPNWTFDEGGFLKREHWQTDTTHASVDYGATLRRHFAHQLLAE